ncbi:hypothetical protein ACHAWU_009824 [Discostella pseudostelligera]|uniref:DNL-type domain-containing protein n=1 Tax=Discostella pseudostelligera TaxID=259834 RepID=A0ABD3M7W5_9STRA
MPSPSSVNSLLMCAHHRVARLFQNRARLDLAKRSFYSVAYQRDKPSIPSPAPSSRPVHFSHCLHNNKCDGRLSDRNELAHQFLESRSNDVRNTSENNTSHDVGESFTDIPGTTNTKAKTLAIIYTCKVCNTRSAKQFTEKAYKHGVVLVKCPGCQNHHLIADRLGWFEDKGVDGQGWDVEKLLAEAGENVKAVSGNDVLELTLDDIAGTKT